MPPYQRGFFNLLNDSDIPHSSFHHFWNLHILTSHPVQVVREREHEELFQHIILYIFHIIITHIAADAYVLIQDIEYRKFNLPSLILKKLFCNASIPHSIALVETIASSRIESVIHISR